MVHCNNGLTYWFLSSAKASGNTKVLSQRWLGHRVDLTAKDAITDI